MSQKKIIFFIIIGVVILAIIMGMAYISSRQKQSKQSTNAIKIWITDGTTESYQKIVEGFKEYAPEFKKTEFIIEKQSSDADRYRTLLLSTATEGNGPDIFMIKNGEDAILETRLEPVPSDLINFSDFEKRFDDIFQDLVYSTGSGNDKQTLIKGVPLGFETLGVFYNKKLIREVPKTWDELDIIYDDSSVEGYPTNFGLGPIFTPNMIDLFPIWLTNKDIQVYSDASENKNAIQKYLNYGDLNAGNIGSNRGNNEPITARSINDEKSAMLENKITTFDLFMQGKIAMIIGYPSIISELEKSSKRMSDSIDTNNIVTEHIPQLSKKTKQNTGKYAYFAISKQSKNGIASAKFLQYLLTPDAQRLFINEYPYIIPAQIDFYTTAKTTSLSDNFKKTKLDSFIPMLGEEVTTFNYGIKSQFEKYLKNGLDNVNSPDIEGITKKIATEIQCEIQSLKGGKENGDCQSR